MDIVAKDLTKAPEAKKKKMLLMVALWAWGLLSLFISTSSALGVLAVAALFTVISVVVHDDPMRISINETGLSITKGKTFLWSAASGDLVGAEVVSQSKRLGVVFSPRRMVVHKKGGDSFSVPVELFNDEDITKLVIEVQHNMVPKRAG